MFDAVDHLELPNLSDQRDTSDLVGQKCWIKSSIEP